jgi:stearoyl-CoA desaturase (delta-9 desaturase)
VAGVLRAAILLQATFCVNSLAHLVGQKRFDRSVSARDSVVTALVTFGEGYHSYHHRFPFDYRNAVRWWQYDPSKWLISMLSWVGLANDLKRVPDMWIHRAQLAMQFKRMERALERKRVHRHDEHFERIKGRVSEEAAAFRRALEEWARVREEWVADRKRNLLQKWEEASFRSRLREIEHRLRMQRRRLRIMTKAYA